MPGGIISSNLRVKHRDQIRFARELWSNYGFYQDMEQRIRIIRNLNL